MTREDLDTLKELLRSHDHLAAWASRACEDHDGLRYHFEAAQIAQGNAGALLHRLAALPDEGAGEAKPTIAALNDALTAQEEILHGAQSIMSRYLMPNDVWPRSSKEAVAEMLYWLDGPKQREAQAKADSARTALAHRPSEGWRPEVRAFADLMEAQLKANDHKPGWKNDDPDALWKRLQQEATELYAGLAKWTDGIQSGLIADPETIGNEAADVANFAMMIADVCGALPTPTSNSPMANRETAAHQEIWLECACGDGHEERTWCDHDAWGTCENPNCAGPVKFIRASDQLYCALAADDGGA
ncbi:MAG: hypothetical protein AAFQ84_06090 [Pseudomonadota bacterium]